MTDILLFLILIVLSGIGYFIYKIYLVVRDPKEKISVEKPAVTIGSYAPSYSADNGKNVGISEAKTPQLIEFEAEQELLKQNQSLGR